MPNTPPDLARVGVEVELLAPPGMSRWDLANALSGRGEVRPMFHFDSEPSLVPGKPTFMHLSRGAEVLTPATACRLVDDITIAVDVATETVAESPGESDDYRILSDEPRLLRLIERHADPGAALDRVLDPIGELFGVQPTVLPTGLCRLNDVMGASIAIAAAQPPGRRRVTEIVTPVLASAYEVQLAALLDPAKQLGFTVPTEAAVHVHFDAEPFRQVARLRRVVELFALKRDELWQRFSTNEHCRRLGPVPETVLETMIEADAAGLDWVASEAKLAATGPSKFLDLNLQNMLQRAPGKDTVEVRLFGPSIDSSEIATMITEMQAILGEVW